MRSLALALLLSCAIPALAFRQDSASNNLQKQNGATAATSHRHGFDPEARYEDGDDRICYTLRTYYFERQDGSAPVPSGMTTCTRISQRDLKHVQRTPRARLLPATR